MKKERTWTMKELKTAWDISTQKGGWLYTWTENPRIKHFKSELLKKKVKK